MTIFDRRVIFFAALSAAAFLLTFSHRPDALLNAQFWAEDGRVWYADAYNFGPLTSLLRPEAGYFQTVSRLVADVGLLLPLAAVPLLFNLFAIGVKVGTAAFIASRRLEKAAPSVWFRLAAAFIYLALPNSYETTANLTNVQWHLAFLAFLVIVASPARSAAGRIFDIGVVALSGLSGPFCLLLLPIAIAKFVMTRERRMIDLLSVTAVCAIVQIAALLSFDRPSAEPLGATFDLAVKIIGGQAFLSPLIGERLFGRLITAGEWSAMAGILTTLALASLLGLAYYRGRIELRLFIIFSMLIIAAAMISPAVTNTEPQWLALATPRTGSRYWMIPGVCLLTSLLFLIVSSKERIVRLSFGLVAFAALIGIGVDWRHPRFADLDFARHAAEFERAPAGTEVDIPVNPPNWEMRLFKK